MTRFAVTVTDHAVLRFIERGLGIEITGIRKAIAEAVADAAEAGAANVVIPDTGLRFCFTRHPENHVRVTTVMPADWSATGATQQGDDDDKKSNTGPDWRKDVLEKKKQAKKRRQKSKKRRGRT